MVPTTRAAQHFVETILVHAPRCADQTAAIRKVREATMAAYVAIALDGAL